METQEYTAAGNAVIRPANFYGSTLILDLKNKPSVVPAQA